MKIAFAGLRHGHILALFDEINKNPDYEIAGAWLGSADYSGDALSADSLFDRLKTRRFDSYEDILFDDSVDVVAVGDYYGARGKEIIMALENGKHVICDKPLCTDISELDRITELSERKCLTVDCMLDLRYDPALRLAQKLIRGGEIGPVHAVNFTGQHPLDYGKRPMWYFEKGFHGGTFSDIAIHGIDAVRFITGLEIEKITCARQWNAFAKAEPDFCDCAQAMVELSGGAGLTMDVSYASPSGAAYGLPSYWRFDFWGENGYIECRLGDDKLIIARSGEETRILTAEKVMDNIADDFLRHVRGEKTAFDAREMFESTRKALVLQKTADERRI